MQSYEISIEPLTPYIQHRDNFEFQAIVQRWQKDPANRDRSIPGDDRSPAWAWMACLYHDGTTVGGPTESIMAACRKAGAEVKLKGNRTLKSRTQSGMAFIEPFLTLTVNGGHPIQMTDLKPLSHDLTFDRHLAIVRGLGFDLDVSPVKVGGKRHIRVRPIFEHFRAVGTLHVWDEMLTLTELTTVFAIAGDRYGWGDRRPSSPSPGPFGRFKVTLKEQ